jgi:hypothetical protein
VVAVVGSVLMRQRRGKKLQMCQQASNMHNSVAGSLCVVLNQITLFSPHADGAARASQHTRPAQARHLCTPQQPWGHSLFLHTVTSSLVGLKHWPFCCEPYLCVVVLCSCQVPCRMVCSCE